jgi:hypothetical protein
MCINVVKDICKKITANIILNGGKSERFLFKICHDKDAHFHYSTGRPSKENKEKELDKKRKRQLERRKSNYHCTQMT